MKHTSLVGTMAPVWRFVWWNITTLALLAVIAHLGSAAEVAPPSANTNGTLWTLPQEGIVVGLRLPSGNIVNRTNRSFFNCFVVALPTRSYQTNLYRPIGESILRLRLVDALGGEVSMGRSAKYRTKKVVLPSGASKLVRQLHWSDATETAPLGFFRLLDEFEVLKPGMYTLSITTRLGRERKASESAIPHSSTPWEVITFNTLTTNLWITP